MASPGARSAHRPLLIDFGDVAECHCNDALEGLFKSMAEDPEGDPRSIWTPMDNPYLVQHVEDVTARFQRALQFIQDAFARLLLGEPIGQLAKAAVPWMRWSPERFDQVRAELERKAPATFSLEDWILVADYLIQRYLPDGVISDEAEYLVVRATILGKIQAAERGATPPADMLEAWATLTPTYFAHVPERALSPYEWETLGIAKTRAALHISNVTEAVRSKMKAVIIEHVQAQVLGQKEGTNAVLSTRLFDEFGLLNRDFRRIAVTEAGECCNQGFVASQPIGATVTRKEAYRGACKFCKSINGKSFKVVAPNDPARNGATDVWVGKTNAGRSASPSKRVGGALTERAVAERWWPAAGVQHPHCFIEPALPIYTAAGWRPISAISVGDLVLTHKGRFRRVNWVLDDAAYTGRVHGAVLSSDGRNLAPMPAMTPEHPVLLERGWTEAAHLRVGDRVASLAKVCLACGAAFVNRKFGHVQYCSAACAPRLGRNQFAADDPAALAAAREQTAEANRRRMRAMTVEQRRALTGAGRAVMAERGYAHLADLEARSRGARSAGARNYQPSAIETAIADALRALGHEPSLQHRLQQMRGNRLGKTRHWWIDIALPEQRIAVEVDGEPWHGRLGGSRDVERDADLGAQGWTVLRVPAEQAQADPAAVAAEIARLAMNHDAGYVFGFVTVERVTCKRVVNRRLYNFGVAEDESYIATGLVVHNCRGAWVSAPDAPAGVTPEFAAFMAGLLARHRAAISEAALPRSAVPGAA